MLAGRRGVLGMAPVHSGVRSSSLVPAVPRLRALPGVALLPLPLFDGAMRGVEAVLLVRDVALPMALVMFHDGRYVALVGLYDAKHPVALLVTLYVLYDGEHVAYRLRALVEKTGEHFIAHWRGAARYRSRAWRAGTHPQCNWRS